MWSRLDDRVVRLTCRDGAAEQRVASAEGTWLFRLWRRRNEGQDALAGFVRPLSLGSELSGVRNTAGKAIQAVLIIVGGLHLLPSTGMLGTGRLAALYGIALQDADLVILMRHRAVLFGILGLLMIGGAFRAQLTGAALGAGIASVASFIALALSVGGYGEALGRVVAIDAAALVLLCMGALLHFGRGRRPR